MKISIQLNDKSQIINFCNEDYYNNEVAEIINRDYPLGLIEIGNTDPATLILKYYINGEFYDKSVNELKQEKIELLQNAFNISKKITIQNGNTLIINHDTPERKIFFDKLKIITQESTRQDISISYQQAMSGSYYRFSAIYTIWGYIFKDLFLADRMINGVATGFKEDVREQNQIHFDAVNLKIQNATTYEELNAITWNFTKPNGIVIDVNDKAEQMLADSTVDAYTKAIINNSKDPVTGEIHLIQEVL